jgi:hypothetical protein
MVYQTGMRNCGRVVEGGTTLRTIRTLAEDNGERICAVYQVEDAIGGLEPSDPHLSNARRCEIAIGRRGARAEWYEYDVSPELAAQIQEVLAVAR